jgi:hypothetical protein
VVLFEDETGLFPASETGENMGEEGESSFCLYPESASETVEYLWMGGSHPGIAWNHEVDQRQYRWVYSGSAEDYLSLQRKDHRSLGGQCAMA